MKKLLVLIMINVVGTTCASIKYRESGSDKVIVRWGFQDMADHIFDPRTSAWAHPTSTKKGGARFNPDDVKQADIVYARDIELFFKEVHPRIKVPYILITHGEFRDTCMEYQLSYLEDSNIIAWFSIHPPKASHPKFYPIPLGIYQAKDFYKQRNLNTYLKKLRKMPKTGLAYLNISLEQSPERMHVMDLFKGRPGFYSRDAFVPFMDYLAEMAHYKFALSPRGWGPDCYRTWEALLVGTIPIVRRCQFDQYQVRSNNVVDPGRKCTITSKQGGQLDALYEELPVLIIDEWEELTDEFLERKYKEITAKIYSEERLYLDYWYNKIMGVRKNYLNNVKGA